MSEVRNGGYTEYARMPAELIVKLPENIDSHMAMQIGTAGYTAALAIHQMELNGQNPEKGPILVSGATGGVGSIAIDMLAKNGYEVTALDWKKRSIRFFAFHWS